MTKTRLKSQLENFVDFVEFEDSKKSFFSMNWLGIKIFFLSLTRIYSPEDQLFLSEFFQVYNHPDFVWGS